MSTPTEQDSGAVGHGSVTREGLHVFEGQEIIDVQTFARRVGYSRKRALHLLKTGKFKQGWHYIKPARKYMIFWPRVLEGLGLT